MKMSLIATGLTDVGLVRKHNEDSLFFDTELGLFIVADGLGGHAAGEVASGIVVEHISKYIEETSNPETTLPMGIEKGISLNGHRLRTAIRLSDKAISDDILVHPERDTMGSTVVACLIEGNRVTMAHVGDSRAYRLDGGCIRQVTRDHSWVAEQVANGILTLEEAKKHPFRNVITQALGNGTDLEIELQEFEISDSETILLCSDGLSGMVSEEQMLSIVNQASNLQDAVSGLIALAIENGGEDNVSVVLVKHSSP